MKKKISPLSLAFVFPLAATLLFGIGCSDDDDDFNGINGTNGTNGTKKDSTITARVGSIGTLSTLETALDTTNLDSTLETTGPFTIFAPSNDAFNRLDSATLSQLLGNPGGALTNLLRYHVISGDLSATDLVARDSVRTLNGGVIRIRVQNGAIFLNDTVRVTITNIDASNGTIHVVDRVLVP